MDIESGFFQPGFPILGDSCSFSRWKVLEIFGNTVLFFVIGLVKIFWLIAHGFRF